MGNTDCKGLDRVVWLEGQRNSYKSIVRVHLRKRILEDKIRCEDDINLNLKEVGCKVGMCIEAHGFV